MAETEIGGRQANPQIAQITQIMSGMGKLTAQRREHVFGLLTGHLQIESVRAEINPVHPT